MLEVHVCFLSFADVTVTEINVCEMEMTMMMMIRGRSF